MSSTDEGRMVANLVGFGRLLRAAGLPVGSDQLITASRVLCLIDLGRREEVYWALHAVLVTRREHGPWFEQAFRLFWRDMHLADRLIRPAESSGADATAESEKLLRRLAESLSLNTVGGHVQETDSQVSVAGGSELEQLRGKDFEQMSAEELAAARMLLQRLPWRLDRVPTRRFRARSRGERIDLRATLRQAQRGPPDLLALIRRTRRQRPPAVVLLCDISGSMDRYSRMLLHFAHTLSHGPAWVDTFVFGTRLTPIRRYLRYRDADQALEQVATRITDWAGGTRIGECLHRFNRDWSRRVLARGARVVLISDGLDRSDPRLLAAEMARLRRSCRRLIWLNPLLRYADFRPRARGVRAMLPHVDELRTAHNVNSLWELAEALVQPVS
jgi:uncharacterized protein with von Willebrand factor type A (vWA) domain